MRYGWYYRYVEVRGPSVQTKRRSGAAHGVRRGLLGAAMGLGITALLLAVASASYLAARQLPFEALRPWAPGFALLLGLGTAAGATVSHVRPRRIRVPVRIVTALAAVAVAAALLSPRAAWADLVRPLDWKCERGAFDEAAQTVCWQHELFSSATAERFTPPLELRESKDGFTVVLDVPGVDEKDIEVTVAGSRLAIRGRREPAKPTDGEKVYARERGAGTFERSFDLPDGIATDSIEASVNKGVLTVRVPKKTPPRARRVSVKNGDASQAVTVSAR